MGKINKVIVVGAGPSGLLLALRLAQNGIPVDVVDMGTKLDEQPRATHYGPPAIYELRRAGLIEEIRRQGLIMESVVWRKLDGTLLTGLSYDGFPEDYPWKITCLPLNKLAKLMMSEMEKMDNVKINWDHKVLSLGQDEKKAWVEVETSSGKKTLDADFIVGCDGANSQIRRSLFGDMNFPGRSWDEQIVATNTYIDIDKFGWNDSNFIIHPEHYFMAARIGKGKGREAMWRITYGDLAGLSREELIERQPKKFETFLPGHPKPDEYTVDNISPYKMHQRCAEKLRVGRFLLVADAGHLCNPFGGLGLTGGMTDVSGLVDCLVGIDTDRADDSILEKYSDIRREKWSTIVDKISSENFRRLWGQDPEKAMETDEFLQLCQKAETDKKLSIEMQMSALALQHDFTQYYKEPAKTDLPVLDKPAPAVVAVAAD